MILFPLAPHRPAVRSTLLFDSAARRALSAALLVALGLGLATAPALAAKAPKAPKKHRAAAQKERPAKAAKAETQEIPETPQLPEIGRAHV